MLRRIDPIAGTSRRCDREACDDRSGPVDPTTVSSIPAEPRLHLRVAR